MQSEAGVVKRAVDSAPTWAWPGRRQDGECAGADWQVVDRALRSLHLRRCGLEAEEARWLREAEALQIWRPLGMVSALDYMERALGYAPRTAQDKLRVARALGALPRLSAALAGGALAYSAVRELTRVVTGVTEEEWVARSAGKNLRQIEELVADHHHGDRPDDPKDPAARTHVVRLEVMAETFALLRQARQVLDEEHGTNLSEDQLVATLCHAVLDGPAQREPTGRAKFQVAITVCERCEQGWQHGAGAKIAIAGAAVERAMCDAQQIGSVDGSGPAKAYQDVSPSVARLVWHRDGGRCRVPGCRSARGLEIHHVVHRADGGGHDAMNLVILCSSCHQAHHAGTLTIAGTAEQLEVRRPGQAAGGVGAACTAELANSGAHVGALERTACVAIDEGCDDVRLANSGAHVGATRERISRRVATASERGDHAGADDEGRRERSAKHAGADDEGRGERSAKLEAAMVVADAKSALRKMGWEPRIVRDVVAAAVSVAGANATLEQVVAEALRRCPHGAVVTVYQARDRG
jgi:HNH endonuclease